MSRSNGFTLVELVIVIVISGIIAAVVAPLIGNKFGAVSQSIERAEWVEQAEFAFLKMRQDLANSVPNSVFTSEPSSGADQVVEMLAAPVSDLAYAARYRDRQLNPYDRLQPNNDNSFDLFGTFSELPDYVSVGTNSATQMRAAWEALRGGGNVGTIARVNTAAVTNSTAENGSPITNISLSANHNFGGHSPFFRAYFTEGPVAYECDVLNGLIYRVSNYQNLATGTAYAARTATADSNRVIRNLVSCEFNLVSGSVYSPPTLYVRLEIGNDRESIELVDAIVLSNGS